MSNCLGHACIFGGFQFIGLNFMFLPAYIARPKSCKGNHVIFQISLNSAFMLNYTYIIFSPLKILGISILREGIVVQWKTCAAEKIMYKFDSS